MSPKIPTSRTEPLWMKFSKWNPRGPRGGYAQRFIWTTHKDDQPVSFSISANNCLSIFKILSVGHRSVCEYSFDSFDQPVSYVLSISFVEILLMLVGRFKFSSSQDLR
jgi:hypothetical protein